MWQAHLTGRDDVSAQSASATIRRARDSEVDEIQLYPSVAGQDPLGAAPFCNSKNLASVRTAAIDSALMDAKAAFERTT